MKYYELIEALLAMHGRLTAYELADMIGVEPNQVTWDVFKMREEEGVIARVYEDGKVLRRPTGRGGTSAVHELVAR